MRLAIYEKRENFEQWVKFGRNLLKSTASRLTYPLFFCWACQWVKFIESQEKSGLFRLNKCFHETSTFGRIIPSSQNHRRFAMNYDGRSEQQYKNRVFGIVLALLVVGLAICAGVTGAFAYPVKGIDGERILPVATATAQPSYRAPITIPQGEVVEKVQPQTWPTPVVVCFPDGRGAVVCCMPGRGTNCPTPTCVPGTGCNQ